MLLRLCRFIGPLRIALLILVGLLLAAAPVALHGASYDSLLILPTVIAPTLIPILIFVLPLDITMMLVFRASATGHTERRRYQILAGCELLLLLVFIAAWIPFVLRLLSP
jgi:hypothetical protein